MQLRARDDSDAALAGIRVTENIGPEDRLRGLA
jgi:hypothetical protein